MYGVQWGTVWGAAVLAPVPPYELPDVVETRRTPAMAGRRATFRKEIVQAPGPAALAAQGDGLWATLHGTQWALAWRRGPGLRLLKRSGLQWDDLTPADLPRPVGASHVALAFDQAGRPVLAWKVAAGVEVRQFSAGVNGYVLRGPFPGHDPILLADLSVQHYTPDSDVVLFYLSPDRTALCARVQRDNYATEYVLRSGMEPMVLDQMDTEPYHVYLWGSRLSDGADVQLHLGPYPAQPPTWQDGAQAAVAMPTGGERMAVVVTRQRTDAPAATVTVPGGGARVTVVLQRTGTDAPTATVAGPASGLRFAVVLQRTRTDAPTATVAGPAGGARVQVVISSTRTDTTHAGVSGPTGGARVHS